jgi:hypothetical protein
MPLESDHLALQSRITLKCAPACTMIAADFPTGRTGGGTGL